MPDRIYLFDTVVLSNFALSASLDLLVSRYGAAVTVTSEVLDELLAGVAAGYSALKEVIRLTENESFRVTSLSSRERQTMLELISHLGNGEASCIAVAAARNAVVVTDDRAARTTCGERNIRVTGTIGILKASCQDGRLSIEHADNILTRMIEQGFYSPVTRIRDIL